MARDILRLCRPTGVWLGVGLATVGAASAAPASWRDAAAATGTDRTTAVLVAICATVLAASLTWLWAVTSVTVLGLVRGSGPDPRTATRRLVLAACGIAVVAGTTAPAHAAGGGDGARLLVGLALPERAVASAEPTAARHVPATDRYVVRAGDSLWSIAVAHPGAGDTATRWRAIWAANRTEIGDDPDLIHPGQALRLPPEQDGAR